jgi:hypothetical protein
VSSERLRRHRGRWRRKEAMAVVGWFLIEWEEERGVWVRGREKERGDQSVTPAQARWHRVAWQGHARGEGSSTGS